ncbi:uncharacterized protein B0H18DRAFT_1168576 [Fomitopsis serialis]|uniref:uncharacterized protein n=1 Tax=Fomitopsis serialis TaxID=139415 RepID=UPI0020089838|nr:uncharacterized protein B0H18DRAFT_1168576 [Neoantrodia serialis]KAH9911486.1 hypothetical protein B0H18DRAFT_1168576 [Neoantrodia serialis]
MKERSQMASLLACVSATYSASVVESVTSSWRFEDHETTPPLSIKTYPEIACLPYGCPIVRGLAFCTTRLSHIASLVLRLFHILWNSCNTHSAAPKAFLLHRTHWGRQKRGAGKSILVWKLKKARRPREVVSARQCRDSLELGCTSWRIQLHMMHGFFYKLVRC